MESQFRLTVVLGFGIPYILYQKSLCLFLVCTSPTLSLISTLSQEGENTLELLTLTDSGKYDLAFHKYSTRNYCAYSGCTLFQHLQVFLLLARR